MTSKAKNTTGLGRTTAHLKAPLFLLLTLVILALSASSASAALPSSFGEEGSAAGQFEEPQGVAVEQETGDVYVSDNNNQRVDKFDQEGHFLLAWGWGVADGKAELEMCTTTCLAGLQGAGAGQFGLRSSRGIAVDNSQVLSQGDVYVIDAGGDRVEKFSPEGAFLLMFGREVNATPATTHPNLCLAGEQCQAGVEVPEGTVAGPGEFAHLGGRSIAVGPTGEIYVGDENRVQRFSATGEVEPAAQISLPGAGFIENLAVDSVGDVYVQARELVGVHEFNSSGTDLGAPRDEAGVGERQALAVGPHDELFVNDFRGTTHHLLEYNAAGTQVASFDAGELGSSIEDGFRGIAYGNTVEALYVLDAGAVRVVSPASAGPLVVSESSEKVEPESAQLSATVNPEEKAGADGEVKYHFEYGETQSYGTSTTVEASPGEAFEDRAVGASLTALQPRTLYHFRVVVENAAGEVTDGPDQTFTTLPPVEIVGESATQVGAETARLGAELNPLGSETEYHFEYGLTTAYEHSEPVNPEASAGSGHSPISVAPLQIQGLAPGTTYHYRVVAHNGFGEAHGEDRTFTTEGTMTPTLTPVLADGRQWEMVSPPNKEGVSLEAIAKEGSVIQAAEDGSGITYIAKAAIEAEAPSNRSIEDTQVLSRRVGGAWVSRDIETPHEKVVTFEPGNLSEYRMFSGDLSQAIVEPQGETALSAGTSDPTPYLRNNFTGEGICSSLAGAPGTSGCYRPLASACPEEPAPCPAAVAEVANAPAGTEWGTEGVKFEGASPDGRTVIVGSAQNLAAGYEGKGGPGLFEWSDGTLSAVSVLPGGESTGEAGLSRGLGNRDSSITRGAVSAGGERVVFSAGATAATTHLYLREMDLKKTVQLDPVEGGVGNELPAEFQAANSDASKVFFTDAARLTGDATARPGEPDLYECEVSIVAGVPSCALKDLTVDANLGQSANVQGDVSALGEDGQLIYFAADGVLAPGAVQGNCAAASEGATCNLYVHDTLSGQTRLVAEVSGLDAPDWDGHTPGHPGNLTARSSPDGRYFTFMSQRSLTGYDNHDASSGVRDEEVYLYDAEASSPGGALRCVSCNPSGARPRGVFDPIQFPGLLVDRPGTWVNRWLSGSIPGWTKYEFVDSVYQSRFLSNSGRMFFNSADALVPQDANGKEDVYEFEPEGVGSCAQGDGCVSLISSGTSAEESAFMDASTDGSNAFFISGAKLSEADIDNDFDIYDAHICTSASPCPSGATAVPPPCTTADSCRAAPSPQPSIFGLPPSATFNGAGNVATVKPAVKAKAKPLTRAQKLSKALSACKKVKLKSKRMSCQKAARKKYGPITKAKKSNHDTRGKK